MEPATQHRIAAVPSLDDIARDPRCIAALERSSLSALLMRSAVVQSALTAQLAGIEASGGVSKEPAADVDDQMLRVDEAAEMLRRKPQWIYRNAARLPFVKRISRKSLLCSKNGISRWLATKKA
jgi:predicted transcriptional regulator